MCPVLEVYVFSYLRELEDLHLGENEVFTYQVSIELISEF